MTTAWKLVESVPTLPEAELICGYLESRGVTVEKESRLFSQEPVTFGALGDVRILVPEAEIEQARELLEVLRREGPELAAAAAEAYDDEVADVDEAGEAPRNPS